LGAGGKEEEIDTALSEPKAKQIYPGLVPGGEAGGWTTYITGTGPGTGRHALLSAPFFGSSCSTSPRRQGGQCPQLPHNGDNRQRLHRRLGKQCHWKTGDSNAADNHRYDRDHHRHDRAVDEEF
jgi:hypothetical protein